MTVPVTAVPPGPVTVNVDALMDAGVIASLNVADSTWAMGTPVAPFVGTVDITAGAGVMVINVHT